tara:strand:- start:5228 stop:5815 length:588 start_codon:yes stop_codon:yes gene_type:complete
MEKNSLYLDKIYNLIWRELSEGSLNRKHPFHLCFLSTISLDGISSESRIVILREISANNFSIRCNCDLRSNKAKEIKKNPNTSLLFYDVNNKIQVRLKTKSEIIENKKITGPIWEDSQEISRRCYYSPPPSSTLSHPFTNDLLDLKSEELGLNVFGLILSKVLEVDYLNLNYNGHIRCKFIIDRGKVVKSNWVTP